MSDASESVLKSIPDIWFDWYARLVPGIFGTAIFVFLSGKFEPILPVSSLLIFLIFAYVVGSIIAPLSTFMAKSLDHLISADDEKYASQKRKANTENDWIPLRNVSKAHSEAVGMLSCGLSLLVNTVYFWNSPIISRFFCIVGILYFVAFFVERSFARRRKIASL